jgi:serine/threonine protein kinase
MSGEAEPRPATFTVLPRGHQIAGRYTIESVIGEGAQSVVYLATSDPLRAPSASPEAESIDQPPSEERVALKVIHRHLTGDPQIGKRFEREAQILKRLDGEHVAKLLDFVEDDGLLALALEHVEGISLEARLAEQRPLPIKEALEIALQICAALGAAHAAGIVHRDLKPANVLIERRAGRANESAHLRIKVVDFGLARVMQGDKEGTTGLTEQGMIFGTPEYMAPEQARGDEADARSDLYAAGVILYEMTVGSVPFAGRSPIGAMTAHLTEAPPSPRSERPGGEISAALEAVILRALEKEPLARYRSARDFAEAIDAARNEPLVIKPALAADDDPSAVDDTDLHLAPPTLATAATLPTHVVSEALREQLRKVDIVEPSAVGASKAAPRPRSEPPSIGTTMRSAAVHGSSPPPRSSLQGLASSDDEGSSLDAPRPTRWIWATVAIIAAAIGVIIGAIVGTR